MVHETTDATFEQDVIKAEGPVIVDFWASWCGPCKMMGPVFEEISEDYEGKLKFVKCNVEENGVAPGTYGVQGIPSLVIFNKGKEFDRLVGFQPKEMLKEKIDALLEKIN